MVELKKERRKELSIYSPLYNGRPPDVETIMCLTPGSLRSDEKIKQNKTINFKKPLQNTNERERKEPQNKKEHIKREWEWEKNLVKNF